MKEQFEAWGTCDHTAVCVTCRHQHLIPKAEQISPQPWLDWLTKHRDHVTFILPHRELDTLGTQIAGFRHNADVKEAYAASADYTITLTSLASDTNLIAGRQGASLSNATNRYRDYLVAGFVTTGTSPTDGRVIEVGIVAALDDTPTFPDGFGSSDANRSFTATQTKAGAFAGIAGLYTNNTSNRTYPFRPLGIRALFGSIPVAHVPWVCHNTGVNLNGTAANHRITYTPVYATVI